MGDPSATLPKKFKTELTDYSIRHESNTGPYADNLDVDVIIVGGGFSKLTHAQTNCPRTKSGQH